MGVNEQLGNLMQIVPQAKKAPKKEEEDKDKNFMSTYTALWGQDFDQDKNEEEESTD